VLFLFIVYTIPMETRKEYSYGIVPLVKEGGEVKIFLIHQHGSLGDIFWGIPKGHQEGDEAPVETAKREVFEETALSPDILDEKNVYTLDYEFVLNDVLIQKQASYFIGWVSNNSFSKQDEEVLEAGWFSFEEAEKKFEFERYKELLKWVSSSLGLDK